MMTELSEGPTAFLKDCGVAAEYAKAVEEAILTVAVSIARPGDWIFRTETARLSSVGSERFLKHFPIVFDGVTSVKRKFDDENGSGYLWIYRSMVSLNGRVVPAEGRCSSAGFVATDIDGKETDDQRDLEGGIMGAALSMMQSSGIKALLGLREVRIEDLKVAGMDIEKMQGRVDPRNNNDSREKKSGRGTDGRFV